MRNLYGFFLLTFIVSSCFFSGSVSNASTTLTQPEAPPLFWRRNSWGISATGEYFSSNANYSETRGSFEKLPGSNSFSVFEGTTRGRFAFTPWLSTYAGLGYAYTQTSDAAANRTNFALDRGLVGADFLLFRKFVRVIPELEIGFPLTSNTVGQTLPMVGHGATYVRAGTFLMKPFQRFTFSSYLGGNIPDQGLAKLFVYNASVEFKISKAFAVGAGVDGFETVMGDTKRELDRSRTALSANAGSARFWAFDPALLEARAWLAITPATGYSIRFGYGKTLNGVRSASTLR